MKLFNYKANKILSFVFCLLFFSVSYSQISGKVEFGTEFKRIFADTSKVTDVDVKDYLVQKSNNAKMALKDDQSYFEVNFNSFGAITKKISIMKPDYGMNPNDYTMVSDYLIYNGKPYEKRSIGKVDFFVKVKKYFTNWEITNEKKIILGYHCIKAKGNLITPRDNVPVEVWYTEEIPASFGPYRYYGLPGLILEVHELGRRHYARKITLKENLDIDFPKEQFLISLEEYKSKL